MNYLGVDIGASKIKAVLFESDSHQKTDFAATSTPQNRKRFFFELEQFINFFINGRKISGIGVGVPGIVDIERKILIKAPNIPFLNGWEVKKFFKRFRKPVEVDNDSRCFLRAEVLWGAAKGCENAVAMTVGTGIGGGIMIGGKIYCGSRNGAGEFGHSIISAAPVITFENLAGKKAFLKYGDRSEIIGIGIANIINSFDPDMVVLGGGGVISGAVNIVKAAQAARKFVISPAGRQIAIVKSKLGDAGPALGAASLLL
ncbi:MAG: ROK family protein [Patescibacteria group bacterium]